jgi:hypothetical protein
MTPYDFRDFYIGKKRFLRGLLILIIAILPFILLWVVRFSLKWMGLDSTPLFINIFVILLFMMGFTLVYFGLGILHNGLVGITNPLEETRIAYRQMRYSAGLIATACVIIWLLGMFTKATGHSVAAKVGVFPVGLPILMLPVVGVCTYLILKNSVILLKGYYKLNRIFNAPGWEEDKEYMEKRKKRIRYLRS